MNKNNKYTRWQIRVDHNLEKVIREKAHRDYRSINKTLLIILGEYFKEDLIKQDPKNQDHKS